MNNALRWIWRITGKRKWFIAALALFRAVQGGMSVLYALLFRNFVDSAVARDGEAFRRAAVMLVVLVLCQIAVSAVIRWLYGLSEGQMQRLAIARAVFADCPILLLDECTSALDEGTEARLLERLHSLTDKTVVIVTHRKAALRICDRVLEFSDTGVREA